MPMAIESIVSSIESRIKVTALELSALHKSLEILRGIPASGATRIEASVQGPDGLYRGQKVGAAVRGYMQNKKSATFDEIRDGLGRGGIRWGKYPKRQVKLAVVNSPKVYTFTDDIVTLIPRF